MAIIEPRWPSESVLSLEAWREFSRRLKALVFIGREVCLIAVSCASPASV
jgi:hypothetical protein